MSGFAVQADLEPTLCPRLTLNSHWSSSLHLLSRRLQAGTTMPSLHCMSALHRFRFLVAATISQSLFLMTLIIVRSTLLGFCKMALYWGSSDIFLMIRCGSRVWGRNVTEVRRHFHYIISKCYQQVLRLAMLPLVTWWVAFVRFLFCKVGHSLWTPTLCSL